MCLLRRDAIQSLASYKNPTPVGAVTYYLFCYNKALLCDFHREQAWDRRLSAHANGVRQYKEVILARLWYIASRESPEEFTKKLKALKESDVWKSKQSIKFRGWMEKT